jgi:acyl-CoA synthetase (AMP-forming)/AMP-acid ligase II
VRVVAGDDVPDSAAADWRPVAVDAEATAYLQYTSGSTRAPAGVEITHGNVVAITPREAAVMGPQQRILLEVVHEALAHAAVPAASLAGTPTGVFVGISAPEYGQLTGADPAAVVPWAPAGAALSVAAGRLAYVLDTRGPSMAVDTAAPPRWSPCTTPAGWCRPGCCR